MCKQYSFDTIIIGAGAAGLYCAIHSADSAQQIAILEKNASIGAKIKVSGGGRCNVTNQNPSAKNYLSHDKTPDYSALTRHSAEDFLKWFTKQGLSYHEKHKGQLFCTERSRAFIKALEHALQKNNIHLKTNTTIKHIEKTAQGYRLTNDKEEYYQCKQLVIACGAPSYPKLGASDSALQFAKQLKLKNYPFRPALVPLILETPLPQLAGISTNVIAHTGTSPKFHDDLLFTHRGLSGPAILQISSYWQKNTPIYINFMPNYNKNYLLEQKNLKNKTLNTALKNALPQQLKNHLLKNENLHKPLAEYSKQALLKIQERLQNYPFAIQKTEGMNKAEASLGGISCQEIDFKNFESKKHPNLYFIGEALDVLGHLGGYNLQWAWSSAWCCAQALKKKL